MLLITWGVCLGGEVTHLSLRYLISGEHVCFKVQQRSELRGRDRPGANRGGGLGASHALLKRGGFPVSELIWNQRGVNGEEGGQRGDAVRGELRRWARSASWAAAAAAGGGRLLGWWEGVRAFAHFPLLLTLVGILQRIIPSQGGRQIKIPLQVEGQPVEFSHPWRPSIVIAAHGACLLWVLSLM